MLYHGPEVPAYTFDPVSYRLAPATLTYLQCLHYAKLALSRLLKLLLPCMENSFYRSSQLVTSSYSYLITDVTYSEKSSQITPANYQPFHSFCNNSPCFFHSIHGYLKLSCLFMHLLIYCFLQCNLTKARILSLRFIVAFPMSQMLKKDMLNKRMNYVISIYLYFASTGLQALRDQGSCSYHILRIVSGIQ